MFRDSKSFLRQIHPESGNADNAEIDIIAVHGLDPTNKKGHAYNTWTDGGKLWLKDFLPDQAGMPSLRILLFGYNSSATFQSSTVGVAGAAQNLLDQLHFKRREYPDRPIVFVCHSLGGIVTKQALVEAHNTDEIHGSILRCTKGIAFFGTPHGGGHGARFGDTIVSVVQALTGNVRNDIMEWLRTDSFLSNHLAANFARRAKNLRVVSFMENLPISDGTITRHFGLVVPPSSSALNWPEPAETRVLMEASHTTICKFATNEDDLYIRVADHMLELITWAAQPQEPSLSSSASIDIPPPPYALEHQKSIPSLRGQNISYDTDDATSDDIGDDEKLAVGWLDRVRAASPFRAPSPRPQKNSVEADQLSSTETQSPMWPIIMLPYLRNPYYVHRSEIWNQMIAMMYKATPIILQGIGGSGKTQMAVHFSYWFRDINPDSSIMWINGMSPETVLTGLGLIASRMSIRNIEGEEHRLMKLKDRLEHPRSGHWLMILDAVDDVHTFEVVGKFIPRCSEGQVLLTSRRNLTGNDRSAKDFGFNLSKVTAFEGATMVHLTMAHNLLSNIDPPEMDRLLRKLDYLPLAIAQAVAFMNNNIMSLKLYLAKISSDVLLAEQLSQSSISDDKVSGLAPAVYSSLKLSFERLQSEHPEASQVLGYLSFMNNIAIPADLLAVISTSEAASTELSSYSFVHWNEDHSSITLERLIQVAVQSWLRETDKFERFKTGVLDVMSDKFPDATLSKMWPRCELWLPHALRLIEICESDADRASIETPRSSPSEQSTTDVAIYHRAMAQLRLRIGLYLHIVGEWTTARDYLEEALETSRQNFGTMDELTLRSQASLIQTLRYLGQVKRANENARDLKRARKAKLGKKDRDTLDSYRMCALTLQDLGLWDAALKAAEKALSGYRNLYKSDPTNSEVLALCRRTASGYIAIGHYDRARTLLQEAIDGYSRRGEAETEPAASCLWSLAMLHTQMKRFAEAEVISRQCLNLRKTILKGADHPDVLKAEYLVGVSLQGQRHREDAEALFITILDKAQAKPGVGRKHFYSLTVLYALGTLEEERAIEDETTLGQGAGRDGLYKARVLLNEVLAGRIEAMGPDHLETLTAKARLAGMHLALGDACEAEKEAQQVLKIVSRKEYRRLGMASAVIAWMCLSTMTISALRNASELEGVPGKDKEKKEFLKSAVNYAKQVAQPMDKILGRQHPDTLDAARAWAEASNAAHDGKTTAKVVQQFNIAAPGTDDFVVERYLGIAAH